MTDTVEQILEISVRKVEGVEQLIELSVSKGTRIIQSSIAELEKSCTITLSLNMAKYLGMSLLDLAGDCKRLKNSTTQWGQEP